MISKSGFLIAAFGMAVSPAAGCSGESGAEGLSVDVTYAQGVPRAARDEAARVEVFLIDSCDLVTIGERPDDAIERMFVLRDGSAGPVIAIPDPGQYGVYAVSQDSNCAVVGAGCNPVTIEAGSVAPISVELGAFSGEGCFANQQCSMETGECSGPSGDCVDLDSDGLGDGPRDNVGCVNPTTDLNSAFGHDYIVLNSFTMIRNAPKLDDDAGVTIRQVAGAILTVSSGGDRLVFEVSRDNIDQNTIADNGGSGIEFYGDDSSGVCFRNNNVTGNGDFGLNADKVVSFDTSSVCRGPLSPGTSYGNNDFDNDNGSCGGDDCLACGCLPPGSFWEYSVNPLYTSTTAGDADLYCLGSSTLIDGGDDLVSYDLNGDVAGDFNGSSPDVGSREDGPGDCN